MAYFRTLPADGRGGGGVSPLISPKLRTGSILDPKMAFDCPGLQLSENVTKFNVNVTDVKGRVKGQIFDYLPSLTSLGNVVI